MFYVKNISNRERVVRVIIGLMGLGYAAMNWGYSGLAVSLGLMGSMLTATGLIGFCSLCALVDCKLDKKR